MNLEKQILDAKASLFAIHLQNLQVQQAILTSNSKNKVGGPSVSEKTTKDTTPKSQKSAKDKALPAVKKPKIFFISRQEEKQVDHLATIVSMSQTTTAILDELDSAKSYQLAH